MSRPDGSRSLRSGRPSSLATTRVRPEDGRAGHVTQPAPSLVSCFCAVREGIDQHPLVMRALEELKMLTQTDVERERYEARRKAQLDYNTGLKEAREEGRAEGRAEGEKIGIIHAFERLLNRLETPSEELARLSPDDLARLADELKAQLQKPH